MNSRQPSSLSRLWMVRVTAGWLVHKHVGRPGEAARISRRNRTLCNTQNSGPISSPLLHRNEAPWDTCRFIKRTAIVWFIMVSWAKAAVPRRKTAPTRDRGFSPGETQPYNNKCTIASVLPSTVGQPASSRFMSFSRRESSPRKYCISAGVQVDEARGRRRQPASAPGSWPG